MGTFTCSECINADFDNTTENTGGDDSSMESGDETMSTQERLQAEFDQNIPVNEENLEEMPEAFKQDESKSESVLSGASSIISMGAQNQNGKNMTIDTLDKKMDKMIDMMGNLKEDVTRVKNQMRKSESEMESFRNKLTTQMNTKVQQTVNKVFGRRENDLNAKLDKHIQKKIDECITHELDKNVEWKFDEKVRNVEISIGQRLHKLEKDTDKDLERTIDSKLQHKMDERIKSMEKKIRNRIREDD